MRVLIIDTNVLVAGLISATHHSPTVQILDAMLDASVLYVMSPVLLREYREVLLRPRLQTLHGLNEAEVDQILSELTANAIWREPPSAHHAPDAGDNHLWDLLLHGDDTILVTGDQLLLNNSPAGKTIITPAMCFELYLKKKSS